MSVYVDESKWRFRGQLYCHMIADTHAELCAMAQRIGLHPDWIQSPRLGGSLFHFDLSPSKRAKAVACGAIEITGRELVQKMFPHVAQHGAYMADAALDGSEGAG